MSLTNKENVEAQEAEIDGMPHKNHGKMVSTAAKLVSIYEEEEEITDECASCIINQFARRIPILEQETCGVEDLD